MSPTSLLRATVVATVKSPRRLPPPTAKYWLVSCLSLTPLYTVLLKAVRLGTLSCFTGKFTDTLKLWDF